MLKTRFPFSKQSDQPGNPNSSKSPWVFDQCWHRVATDLASQAEKQMGVDHT